MSFYEKYFFEEDVEIVYESSLEQIQELFSFLDILLNLVLMVKLSDENKGKLLKAISTNEEDILGVLSSYELENQMIELSDTVKNDINKVKIHLIQRSKLSENSVFLRFNYIVEQLYLSDVEVICLLLGLASEYDKKYEVIYSAIENDKNTRVATMGLAMAIMEVLHSFSVENWNILSSSESNFCRFLFNQQKNTTKYINLYSKEIFLKKRVVEYLFGNDMLDEHIGYAGYLFDAKKEQVVSLDIHIEKAEQICYVLKNYKTSLGVTAINLIGEQGIGKTTIIKNVAKRFGLFILFIDINLLLQNVEDKKEILNQVLLEQILSNSFVCFICEDAKERELLQEVIRFAKKNLGLFFLLSVEPVKELKTNSIKSFVIELPNLSIQERSTLWSVFGKEYKIAEEVDISSNASKYLLNPKGIQDVLATAWFHCCSEDREKILQKDIVFAINQHNFNQLGEMATLINAVFTWNDLIVEEEQKKQMRLICNQLNNKGILEEEWGFGKKIPYGRGISALFYGSPGTGKTMAAQVMANELGLDLYRIDISQMVSKYIGETEKNIAKLFEKAKHMNALLFFDEADALFSKRSEVKDAHDRSANMEVAYLLQKLEEYEGISILATNYLNNIDDAFKRRIRFIVNFALPNADIRHNLWKNLIPKEAKVKDNIDFEFFAKHFEISGSNIKEILINSAHMAIADKKAISNYYIIQSIKNNFQKNGKLLISADFGEYEALF